jgi:hypothetical protein
MKQLRFHSLLLAATTVALVTPLRADSAAPFESIEAEVVAKQMLANDAGTHVCLFGNPVAATSENGGRTPYDFPTELRVIALDTGATTQRIPMLGDLRHVVVTSKFVFWVPTSVNVLYRASLSKQEEVLETPMQEPILECFETDDGRLVLLFAQGESAHFEVLDQETLEYDKLHSLAGLKLQRYPVRAYDRFQRLGDGEYFIAGRVIDQADGETKCVVERAQAVIELLPGSRDLPRTGNVTGDIRWRRKLSGRGVTKSTGPELFSWNSSVWDVSRTRPVAAVLIGDGYRPVREYQVVLRGLVFGQILQTEPVKNSFVPRGQEQGFPTLKFAGDRLVLATGDTLRWIQLEDEMLNSMLEPLRILHPVVPIHGVDDLQRCPLQTRGGSGDIDISFSTDLPHVQLEDDGKQIVVDWPSLWSDFIAAMSTGEEIPLMYANSLKAQNKAFWNYYEIPGADESEDPGANRVVVAATMVIKAADQSGQDDSIAVSALAVAPKAPLLEAIEQGKKALVARQEERYQQRMPEANTMARELTDRVTNIDKRLERIEKLLEEIASDGKQEEED